MSKTEIYDVGDIISLVWDKSKRNEWLIKEQWIGGYLVENLLTKMEVTPEWSHCKLLRKGDSKLLKIQTNCPLCDTPWNVSQSPVRAEKWKDCLSCGDTAENIVVFYQEWKAKLS